MTVSPPVHRRRIPGLLLLAGWLVAVGATVFWFHLHPPVCPILTGYQAANQQNFDCQQVQQVWQVEQLLLSIGYGIAAALLSRIRWGRST